MTLHEILDGLTLETWPTKRHDLFNRIVEEGLDAVETNQLLKEVARRLEVPVEAVRRAFSDFLGPPPGQHSVADELVKIAEEAGLTLWHDPQGEGWASIWVDGHLEHHPLKAKAFRRWLSRRYWEKTGKTPYAQALQDALEVLEGEAIHAGEERQVCVRLGEWNGKIYLDLGRPDWRAVEVDATGWRVLEAHQLPPQIAFRRLPHQRPLPEPIRGGGIDALRGLVPLKGGDWPLVLGWLAGGLNPRGPFPILLLTGEKGAGKSTIAQMLKAILDPAEGALRTTPRHEEDLFVAARGNWVLAYDNLSGVPGWLSDRLCVLATGGALSKRQLYTDADEVVLEAKRPVILTGIGLSGLPDDLTDRLIRVELPRLDGYTPERELWARLEGIAPYILAALLDAASLAMRRWDEVASRLRGRLPRMADWAIWAEAGAPALGLAEGEVLEAYLGVREGLEREAVDTDPVALALERLARTEPGWYSTKGLLEALRRAADLPDGARPDGWPRTPEGLARRLPRLRSALRVVGVDLTERKDPHTKGRLWGVALLEHRGNQPPQPPQPPKIGSRSGLSVAEVGAEVAEVAGQPPEVEGQPPHTGSGSTTGFAEVAEVAEVASTPVLKEGRGGQEEEGWYRLPTPAPEPGVASSTFLTQGPEAVNFREPRTSIPQDELERLQAHAYQLINTLARTDARAAVEYAKRLRRKPEEVREILDELKQKVGKEVGNGHP